MMDKKAAIGMKVLGILIITIAICTVIIYIALNMLLKSSAIADNQKCKTSFFAAAQLSKLYDKSQRTIDIPPPINCKRKEIVIDFDSTTRIGGQIDDVKVKSKIMNAMLNCWAITGSGKLDPSRIGGWMENTDERFCLVCSEISFSDKFQKKAKEQNYVLTGLVYFAAAKRLPGDKVTPYQQFGGEAPPTSGELVKLMNADWGNYIYDLSLTYSVFWRIDVYSKSVRTKFFEGVGEVVTLGLMTKGTDMLVATISKSHKDTTLMAAQNFDIDGTRSAAFGMGNLLANKKQRPEVHIAPMEVMAAYKAPWSGAKYCTYMMN